MHAVFFGLKRAHHGTLRITRGPLKKRGLTPARFDLLYAVKLARGGVVQSVLRKILGVCRATVSKMLASLEKLGLVKRTVYPRDRRQRLVRLTWPGRKSIGEAQRDFVRSGWAELAFASAIGCTGLYRWYSEGDCLRAKSWLLARLDALRQGLGDFASLEYPWDPEGDALDRLEDGAFEDPFAAVEERERREAAEHAPPAVDAAAGFAWDDQGPFPWDDEGVLTWEELQVRERALRRRLQPPRRRRRRRRRGAARPS